MKKQTKQQAINKIKNYFRLTTTPINHVRSLVLAGLFLGLFLIVRIFVKTLTLLLAILDNYKWFFLV